MVTNEGFLEFGWENQGCWIWCIPVSEITSDDPPVFYDDRWGKIFQVNSSISEYAIQQLLYKTKFNFFGGGTVEEQPFFEILEAIESEYTRCALPDLYAFGCNICFFEGVDTVIEVWRGGSYLELWFGTRTKQRCREALVFFENIGVTFDNIIDDEIYLPNFKNNG
ncbi:MAG: hypothetical protein SVX43_12830 [Cyanobacteriota bacterium]|nr:hypothetical protein [Cyanobacteriota bacterium]